jgi:hypothetical protein
MVSNTDETSGNVGFDPLPLSTDGVCFAQTAPQLSTRIVTRQVEVVPAVTAADGTVQTPPVFRNQTGPVTEEVAPGTRFATLCPDELTPERVATLQRALKARLAFNAPITGVYDAATSTAVQAFQVPLGIDSPELARSLAQRLGLIPFDAETTNAFGQ